MEERRSTLKILSSVLGIYLSLKTDDFKYKITSALSVGFSRILSAMVILMLAMVALIVLALALILLLGGAIGSYMWAAFIIGGALLTIAGILFLIRKKT